MRLFLYCFALFVIFPKSFSQVPIPVGKRIYLDSTWTKSTEDNYKYIRIVEKYYSDQKTYIFKDYYKSNQLQMIGASLDKDILKHEGQFIYYYENGNKKSTVNYANSHKTGKEFTWYESGNIESELEYTADKKGKVDYKINNFWTDQKEQKVINGNGDFQLANEYGEESGKVKNGLPDGIWKGQSFKRKTSFTETYENGKLVSGITTDSLNIEHPYTILNKEPCPKKGMNTFYNYVANAVRIPNELKNKISGKIFLTFVVEKDGSLVEPKIIKGLGYGLDENAIKVINNAKKWNPGIRRGLPVRVLYSLPITIVTD